MKPDERVVFRGDAEFEEAVESPRTSLRQASYGVAEGEIREALHDISRRPEPDLTGAIHHGLGGLESTAKYLSGSEKPFNEVISLVGVPKPLDRALSKLWGYSSNFGRHVRPTKVASLNDATLVVHLSSAICRYLVEEHQ